MNVYEKLSMARIQLQQSELKKSGHNKNLNFYYMELEDFLPRTNEINAGLKILPVFSISENHAELKIIDIEKPEESIMFSSHTATATLRGGAAPIQELGSQHTYMRRYLFIMAYEITEKDTLDPSIGKGKKDVPNKASSQQTTDKMKSEVKIVTLEMVKDLASKKGVTDAQILAKINNNTPAKEHVDEIKKLTQAQLTGIYKLLGKAK
jgi:hypothetical protein